MPLLINMPSHNFVRIFQRMERYPSQLLTMYVYFTHTKNVFRSEECFFQIRFCQLDLQLLRETSEAISVIQRNFKKMHICIHTHIYVHLTLPLTNLSIKSQYFWSNFFSFFLKHLLSNCHTSFIFLHWLF